MGKNYTDDSLLLSPQHAGEPDTDAAVQFLDNFRPGGPHDLVAIDLDGNLRTARFGPGDREQMRAWIGARQGKANLYFHVNPLREKPAKGKAAKSDVAAAEYLHVDIDDANPAALERLRRHDPPPSVIVFSGGGYHGYWKLSEPCADLDQAERRNKAIADALGGDNCQNVDRIMRLPGTINVPDAKKRARGRMPALAHVFEADWSQTYAIDEFSERAGAFDTKPSITLPDGEVAPVEIELLPASVSEATRALILAGDDLERPIGSEDAHYPSRSEALFAVICALIRADCADEIIAGVLLNPNHGISASVLDKRNPRKEAFRQIAKARAKQLSPEDHLARLNAEYCVVSDGGKVRVLRFEVEVQKRNGREVHRREVPELMSFPDFHNFHSNQFVQIGKKAVPLGRWWTSHPERRSYSGLTFQPTAGSEIDGRLNLWRGWGVEPRPGDWSLMRRHIAEVLADGDKEAEAYILNWAAWAVQHPAEQAEVALVLKGGRGAGKGALGRAMCRIFGQHATHISSSRHLAGHFNAHLRDTCLLFADEAYWPGDKAAEGTLKRLITEPTLFIEAKYKDGRNHPNMLHVIMASNEDWVVPAGEHERRYAVFRISDHQMQKNAWFEPLFRQMDEGGYAAMLHDLLHIELADWHPRRIPRTAALVEQQSLSLRPEEAAWVGLLEEGALLGADENNPARAVSNEYEEDIGDGDYPRIVRRKGLFDQIRRIVPRIRNEHENRLRHILKENGAKPVRFSRRRGWELPPLAEARAAWEARYPGWEWSDPTLTEWQLPEEFSEEEEDAREKKREFASQIQFMNERYQLIQANGGQLPRKPRDAAGAASEPGKRMPARSPKNPSGGARGGRDGAE